MVPVIFSFDREATFVVYLVETPKCPETGIADLVSISRGFPTRLLVPPSNRVPV